MYTKQPKLQKRITYFPNIENCPKDKELDKINKKSQKKLDNLIKESNASHVKNKIINRLGLGLLNSQCNYIQHYCRRGSTCFICKDTNIKYEIYIPYKKLLVLNMYIDSLNIKICKTCQLQIDYNQKTRKANMIKSFFYIKQLFSSIFLQYLYPLVINNYKKLIEQSNIKYLEKLALNQILYHF